MRWSLRLAVGGALLWALAHPWPATRPCRWGLQALEKKVGWSVSIEKARWIPWGDLELTDVKLLTPQGGLFHVGRAQLFPEARSLVTGALRIRLLLREIRMDPGSLGIRKPLLMEILSAGPVAEKGFVLLDVSRERVFLRRLTLQGPFVWLQGQGSVDSRAVSLELEGAVAREPLEEMHLVGPTREIPSAWEPFSLRLGGRLQQPEFSFHSGFFSIALKPHGEQRS
ncbi:MAG: hypothetical protein HYZ90_01060 [Candidatus Omnitrophica bacterium]|nr:hypothetical protein [Candidatus Omnitrophota bacterium]